MIRHTGDRITSGRVRVLGILLAEKQAISHHEIEERKELKVMIVYHSDAEKGASLKIVKRCWDLGLKAFIDFSGGNIKKHFKKGDKIRANFAFIIGKEEVSENFISIKNMKTREQEKIKNEDLEKWIKKYI